MALCPSCGKDNTPVMPECKYCGLVFKKWTKHVKQKQALGLMTSDADEPIPTALAKRVKIGVGIALALVLLGYFLYKKITVTLGPNDIGFPIVEDGKWGFINAKGRLVVSPQFDAAEQFSDGLAAVMKKNRWGYINRKGKLVIPARYDRAGAFSEGLALARLITGYWEVINKTGKAVGTTNLDPVGISGGLDISTFHDGRAIVENLNKKKTFINASGIAMGSLFDEAKPFSEGLALVRQPGLAVWIFIRPDGTRPFYSTFIRAGSFSDGLAAVEKVEGRSVAGMGYINHNGDYILPPFYLEAGPFREGLAWVKANDGICGPIDRVGRIVFQIGCSDLTEPFAAGLGPILKQSDGKYGAVNPDGAMILGPAFSTPPIFVGGLAFVAIHHPTKGIAGYVNRWGDFVWKTGLKSLRISLNKNKERERNFLACHLGAQLVTSSNQK